MTMSTLFSKVWQAASLIGIVSISLVLARISKRPYFRIDPSNQALEFVPNQGWVMSFWVTYRTNKKVVIDRLMVEIEPQYDGEVGFDFSQNTSNHRPIVRSPFHAENSGWIVLEFPGCAGTRVSVKNSGSVMIKLVFEQEPSPNLNCQMIISSYFDARDGRFSALIFGDKRFGFKQKINFEVSFQQPDKTAPGQ